MKTQTWSSRLPCGCIACRACHGTGRTTAPGRAIELCARCNGTRHSRSPRVRRLVLVEGVLVRWTVLVRSSPIPALHIVGTFDEAIALANQEAPRG